MCSAKIDASSEGRKYNISANKSQRRNLSNWYFFILATLNVSDIQKGWSEEELRRETKIFPESDQTYSTVLFGNSCDVESERDHIEFWMWQPAYNMSGMDWNSDKIVALQFC